MPPRKPVAGKKPTGKTKVAHVWAKAAAPPPALTVSEWADAKRMLPESSGARGARWRTDDVPYLRGIMDAALEPGVKKIGLEKAAQVAGSEAINNILGYFIEHDPCPILLVQPTEHVAQEWSKERLADMLRSTPALGAVVSDKRGSKSDHQGESTLMMKMFPGGFLVLGGANTPNSFARRSIRLAIGDDVDRFPPVVGDEGDPADLLAKRTTTFIDGLVIMVSTPTLKGGRIDSLFHRGDQRRFFVACPICGREDWITWSDPAHFSVVWEGHDAKTAALACPLQDHGGCGARFTEADRRQMILAAARRPDCGWRPTAEPQEPGLVTFHLPAMITTLGQASLQTWVEDFLAARSKGKESLRVFINTTLAEGWEDRGARMDAHVLMNRREAYGADGVEIPAWAVALTAGVDVQENRFELQVQAWGPAMERAVIDWRSIPGDPKRAETRVALLEALSRKYAHALGPQLPIHATCIDSGYATDEVYQFVLAYQVRRIFATKGIPHRSGEPIVGKPSEKRHGRDARPVRLYPINVEDAKADVMNALSLAAPGPGYIHFPLHVDTIDDEYFAQLCAEHRETKYNRLGVATHQVWEQDRERNEALDTAVLCLAAYKLLNPNIRQMLEALGAHVARPAAPATSTPPPESPARKPAAGRRFADSPYLGGQG